MLQTLVVDLPSTAPRAAWTFGEAMRAAVEAQSFAWTLYRRLSQPDVNFVYSPYSITTAVAMLSAGARGETLTEIQSALGFPPDPQQLRETHNALVRHLATRNHAATAKQPAQTLRIVNDVWLSHAAKPHPQVIDTAQRYYGAGLHLADFEKRAEECRRHINERLRDVTNGLIPTALPEGAVTRDTAMLLANALYFKGTWATEFDKASTLPRPFHGIDGAPHQVPTMRQTARYAYVRSSDIQVVALPYLSDEIEMVILLPDPGRFTSWVAGVDAPKVARLLDGLRGTRRIDLRLPRFRIDMGADLIPPLRDLGMKRVFDGDRAQLKEWCGGECWVNIMSHAAVLILDEEGTEAAATTTVGTVGISSHVEPPPLVVDVNRPFVFLLRDRATRALLFVGHVVNLGA